MEQYITESVLKIIKGIQIHQVTYYEISKEIVINSKNGRYVIKMQKDF